MWKQDSLLSVSYTHLDVYKRQALYYFTKDKQREAMMLKQVSYGGGCINDTIVHLATSHMPFGGVGHSRCV